MRKDKYVSPLKLNQVPFVFTNTKGYTYYSYMKKPDKRSFKGCDGICSDPEEPIPMIYIRPGMSDRREMNTQIHEVAHAFFWDKSETDIRRYADTVSRYLYEMGWRKTAEPTTHVRFRNKLTSKYKKGKK